MERPTEKLDYVSSFEAWLEDRGVTVRALAPEEANPILVAWFEIYEYAFVSGQRFRTYPKAEHAFLQESACCYLVFSAPCALPGTHVCEMGYHLPEPYRCKGPLVSLREFSEQEPVVTPEDLSWTMVYVDPDPLGDGPYFARREWVLPV